MNQPCKKCLQFILIFCFCYFLVSIGSGTGAFPQEEKVSEPGKYKGYSKPIYDEWVRLSQYVTVRDGTRLAVDICRPAKNGIPVSEPLPLIWTHSRYHRAHYTEEGKIRSVVDSQGMQRILKHGYIIAAVDVRGGGASFGIRRGIFTPEEAQDSYDINEWFAKQPWCDGNIGMFGSSYLGITQYIAAGMGSPHLKAIVPEVAMFDLYSFSHPGGVYQDDFIRDWSGLVKQLDIDTPTPPVDEDPQSVLAKEAIELHKANVFPYEYTTSSAYRDTVFPGKQIKPSLEWTPNYYLKGINTKGSHVAVYTVGGWYDIYPRDALAWFNNLKNPQKVIILPGSHSGTGDGWKKTTRSLIGFDFKFDLIAEHLRWYDYWLKGIDNGIMDEQPISYFIMGAPEDNAWRSARKWPLPEVEKTHFYFHEGPSGSVNSTNDGLLKKISPESTSGGDSYQVDYTTTSGKTTRWTDGRGMGFEYGDMSTNDKKALTYTTAPLEEDLEVTGHPVVSLWVSSTARDGDFFVYLEEVDTEEYSHYITEGVLRASHRKLSEPPFKYSGLPYHRSFEEDIEFMPEGEPVQLIFDLHPTSNIFNAGHRIRITVSCADQNNFETPELSPPPTITMHRNSTYASYVTLPVISSEAIAAPELGNLLIIIVIVIVLTVAVVSFSWYVKSKTKK